MSETQVPIDEARADIDAANERMGEQGLRVLAFAARFVDDDELDAMRADPMSLTQDLDFVGMVGIIDPLRAEAKGAVQTALGAGIDVRMITGDHAVTAKAIGETRARTGRDQRERAAGNVRRRAGPPAARSSTCSAASRPRTSSVSLASCRRKG